MPIKSILITGANRGLGFEFVRQLVEAKPAPEFVFAGCRNPDSAKELQKIAKEHPNVKIVKIEIGNEASYQTAVQEVTKEVGDQGLNVLFNVAGILNQYKFDNVTAEAMIKEYEVDCIGPLMLSKAFYPLLKKAASLSKEEGLSCSRAAVLNMTSGLGCIGNNDSGGMYTYRPAKAALNMVTKCMSIDFKSDNILAVSMAPGWVATDMGGANATLTPSQSVGGLLDTMAKLTEKENGSVMSYKGLVMNF